jgi:hypothetical protein
MKLLTDEKAIEFLWKSPVKSFAAMLDAFRYLDGKSVHGDVEYELFDEALGDNPEQKIQIRVPDIGGIPANALFVFARHAFAFNLIRRRSRMMRKSASEPEEIFVFYELTSSGSYILKLLEVLTDVSSLAQTF